MERFQLIKPVFSTQLPDRLRKAAAIPAALWQTRKETVEQLQQTVYTATENISYAAENITLALMRTGLHVATDLQRFFLADISVYSCLQYAASLAKQVAAMLKK